MLIDNKPYRTIWIKKDNPEIIQIIDQRKLPHIFEIVDLQKTDDFVTAIKEMYVRGAPLIGVTAAFGIYATLCRASSNNYVEVLKEASEKLIAARPTAVNLKWGVGRMLKKISPAANIVEAREKAFTEALAMADEDAEICSRIGDNGVKLIEEISRQKNGAPVNILTHCNAGWLATVDWGTATAPIYKAAQKGIKLHVWVDETRPRNQGAKLTAWEFVQNKIDHTLIVDNAGGHLMQHGMVDIVIVGSDRTTHTGDVANKIGTYLKALAAIDNNVPFYVALPMSTIDWEISDGVKEIPIEQRGDEEVKYVDGLTEGNVRNVLICPEETTAANYAFDVTPARLVSGLITEEAVMKPEELSTKFTSYDSK